MAVNHLIPISLQLNPNRLMKAASLLVDLKDKVGVPRQKEIRVNQILHLEVEIELIILVKVWMLLAKIHKVGAEEMEISQSQGALCWWIEEQIENL